MKNKQFDWEKVKKLNTIQILLAVILPSSFAFVGFRVVLPIIVNSGVNELLAWSSMASSMLLVLVLAGFLLVKKEASVLKISIKERMCLKSLSLKEWFIYLGLLIVGIFATLFAGKLNIYMTKIPFLEVPSYMPFILDPYVDVAKETATTLVPGLNLAGAYWVIPLMAITLTLNILAEDIYFRAWLLPKMSDRKIFGVFMNSVLFALYHSFQLWLFPQILVSALIFGFVVYKSKSIWPSFVFHMVFNVLTIIGMMGMIIG